MPCCSPSAISLLRLAHAYVKPSSGIYNRTREVSVKDSIINPMINIQICINVVSALIARGVMFVGHPVL